MGMKFLNIKVLTKSVTLSHSALSHNKHGAERQD